MQLTVRRVGRIALLRAAFKSLSIISLLFNIGYANLILWTIILFHIR